MATNYYFVDKKYKIVRHIGKRKAAGLFCWECNLSLCAAGNHQVHQKSRWLDECAICGRQEIKNNTTRKKGVARCSSFTWAVSPGRFQYLRKTPNLIIQNEYGETLTNGEFALMLSECPIQYFDLIGEEFS